MSYSTLSTVAIALAFLAIALAVVCAMFVWVRRRQWARLGMSVMLSVLAVGTLFSFLAAAASNSDVQRQARHVMALAEAGERASLHRYGRYTTSLARLWRLRPGLAAAMRADGASVHVFRGVIPGSVELQVTLGFGTITRRMVPHEVR